MVSENTTTVAAPQPYGEKLDKPAMIVCGNEVLTTDAASTLSTIPPSNETIPRKQNEVSSFLKDGENSAKKTKLSIQEDESTIHNHAILRVYASFIHEDEIRGKCNPLKNIIQLLMEKKYSMN